MKDVIEVSYTGDLLAHRRCPRAWAYESYAQFQPYEQVQAMEGRLVHHAMEWLARQYRQNRTHPPLEEFRLQLEHHFRVLWARGVKTAFASKAETLNRVQDNLFPSGKLDSIVRTAVEGALHTEYELRTVRKLIKADFLGKSRLLLTGVLDLVVQQEHPLTYHQQWKWKSVENLTGDVIKTDLVASPDDREIWDYKATREGTPYIADYVRQLMTYAALYRDRTGSLVQRCVLFFVNEPDRRRKLIAIPLETNIVDRAVQWTEEQVKVLRKTTLQFENDPCSVEGGSLQLMHKARGKRTDEELSKQCTACGRRFDCSEYFAYLSNPRHPDIRLDNVSKN
jgi:DNA helicase II / ATP-dependent DNA helicase PcrA